MRYMADIVYRSCDLDEGWACSRSLIRGFFIFHQSSAYHVERDERRE